MSETAETAIRYVLAEDSETGETRCFAALRPRVERYKDPFRRRRYTVQYVPRYSLRAIYTGDGADWSGLESSPFWLRPRLAKRSEVPEGVQIP